MAYDNNRILHTNGTLEFRVLIDRGDVSEDGVEYYCQLTNAFGSVISRTALLQSASKLICRIPYYQGYIILYSWYYPVNIIGTIDEFDE